MKKNDKKIFVIGIDGATFKILDKLHKQGKTPFLSSLRKQSYGDLISTIPAISAPAWASFQTGVNPGKHSIYDFFYRKNGVKNVVNANDIKAEKLRDYFGKAGYKCFLLNMPLSYPVSPMNGVLVSSFLTPKNSSFAYPLETEKKLKDVNYKIDLFLGGDDAFAPNEKLTEAEKKSILDNLLNIAKTRAKAFKKLYKKDDYKLSFIYFKGSDIIQHLDFDGNLTEKYFISLDKILSDLEKFVLKENKNTYTFVISDHGFHRAPMYEVFVYKWFVDNFIDGIVEENAAKKTWTIASEINSLIKKTGINLSSLPYLNKLRSNLISKANQEKEELDGKDFRVDVKGIYLGPDYTEEEKENIKTAAKLLLYEDKKVFQKVEFRERVYSGEYLIDAPDIVWITNEEFVVNPLKTAKNTFGIYETNLSGEHYSDRNGVFFVKGKGVKRTKVQYFIEDILPTLMYIAGIDIPDKIDGKVMADIFDKRTFNKPENKLREFDRLNNFVTNQFINVRNHA